jgi:hypothetical protein
LLQDYRDGSIAFVSEKVLLAQNDRRLQLTRYAQLSGVDIAKILAQGIKNTFKRIPYKTACIMRSHQIASNG